MITLRELEYVNGWARKIPYPGLDYTEKVAEKLISSYESFNQFYKDKQYDIITSSGEQILFEIMDMNLCHMLGIDFKNLISEYFENYRRDILGLEGSIKSYDLLASIVENIDDVLRYDYDNRGKVLNYYRIMIKCSIFEKLSDFSRFNFGVINFDSRKYEEIAKSKFSGKSTKFLYVQSNEPVAPIFMMGILRNGSVNGDADIHVVESLLAPTNITNFFYGQEVSIPTQIMVTTSDEMRKMEATPAEKIALLNQYKSIITEYRLPNGLNIYGDYQSMLVDQSMVLSRRK